VENDRYLALAIDRASLLDNVSADVEEQLDLARLSREELPDFVSHFDWESREDCEGLERFYRNWNGDARELREKIIDARILFALHVSDCKRLDVEVDFCMLGSYEAGRGLYGRRYVLTRKCCNWMSGQTR
jgi:hypothetical protein